MVNESWCLHGIHDRHLSALLYKRKLSIIVNNTTTHKTRKALLMGGFFYVENLLPNPANTGKRLVKFVPKFKLICQTIKRSFFPWLA
jgi:hypothetical protein